MGRIFHARERKEIGFKPPIRLPDRNTTAIDGIRIKIASPGSALCNCRRGDDQQQDDRNQQACRVVHGTTSEVGNGGGAGLAGLDCSISL